MLGCLFARMRRVRANGDAEAIPDDPDFLAIMGELSAAVAEDEPAAARECLEKALVRWPGYGGLYLISAIAYAKTGDLISARADLAVALALRPHAPVAYKHLAYVLQKEGKVDLAEQVLERGWEAYRRILGHVGRHERDRFFSMEAQGPPTMASAG